MFNRALLFGMKIFEKIIGKSLCELAPRYIYIYIGVNKAAKIASVERVEKVILNINKVCFRENPSKSFDI